jgi:hypothetical protein
VVVRTDDASTTFVVTQSTNHVLSTTAFLSCPMHRQRDRQRKRDSHAPSTPQAPRKRQAPPHALPASSAPPAARRRLDFDTSRSASPLFSPVTPDDLGNLPLTLSPATAFAPATAAASIPPPFPPPFLLFGLAASASPLFSPVTPDNLGNLPLTLSPATAFAPTAAVSTALADAWIAWIAAELEMQMVMELEHLGL